MERAESRVAGDASVGGRLHNGRGVRAGEEGAVEAYGGHHLQAEPTEVQGVYFRWLLLLLACFVSLSSLS